MHEQLQRKCNHAGVLTDVEQMGDAAAHRLCGTEHSESREGRGVGGCQHA